MVAGNASPFTGSPVLSLKQKFWSTLMSSAS